MDVRGLSWEDSLYLGLLCNVMTYSLNDGLKPLNLHMDVQNERKSFCHGPFGDETDEVFSIGPNFMNGLSFSFEVYLTFFYFSIFCKTKKFLTISINNFEMNFLSLP